MILYKEKSQKRVVKLINSEVRSIEPFILIRYVPAHKFKGVSAKQPKKKQFWSTTSAVLPMA